MASAKKLPSGSWRCQVYSHTEKVPQADGTVKQKRIYKSFTCDNPSPKGKRRCEKDAAEWALTREAPCVSITLSAACQKYIDSREHLLSPSTVKEYKRMSKKIFPELMNISLPNLTQEQIQNAVNNACISHSPKTVRNMHGFLSAVLSAYRPDFALRTVLPKKVRVNLYLPSDDEIKTILDYVKGTEMELPILLAAFGTMRRSEICALDSEHISGNTVHVEYAMVMNANREWVIKRPKSYAGDRYITFPDFVINKTKGIKGKITNLNPSMVTLRFEKILEDCNIPHFRFHDLRHYSASVQHALGVPDSYIMQRGGWGSDKTLKAVYRHTMEDKEKEMNDKVNNYFSELCNTKCNTK